MKTTTMILAAGILSVGAAAAHAQSSIAAPGAPKQPSAQDQTALMSSLMSQMQNMNSSDLTAMLAQISAMLKADSSMTTQQLDVARTNPTTSSPDVLQAKLDALQRLQTQTNASKDMLAAKIQPPAAPAAPTIPAGMTQAQYQQLMRAQQGEAQDLEKILSQPPLMTPLMVMGLQSMQKARADQDAVARPSSQQIQARQQLDGMLKQMVRTAQQKQQAMQLLKQSQWQPPAAPAVALTAQQQAQLAAMVTPQHQALLTALTQAQDQLAAARARQASAQQQLRVLQSQMGPSTMATLLPKIVEAQRAIIDANGAVNAAQQNVAQAQQQAAPALQAVSAQAAAAAQMRAQRAQMTPAQLAAEKAQQEYEAALLRKEQLKAAQLQLPVVQQQLKDAQEQLPVRQKASAQQVEQLRAQQAEQIAAAQARIDNLQKMPPSTPGLQQQMQAAGQQMGGLQRQQQQQLQGLQQAQYQDQQSQQKHIASLQQLVASLQQQINMLQGQQAQAMAPSLSPDMQKQMDAMMAGSTAQIDQILQAMLAQANQMNSIMQGQR